MPLDMNCPHCGHAWEVPAAAAGQESPCPACGASVAVPLPAPVELSHEADADEAIATAPSGAAARPPRPRRPVTELSLLAPARNGPARVASTCALLSLVPGFGLLFGPLAVLLGLLGLAFGRGKGVARSTRDVRAAVGVGLLTAVGSWALLLYVVSVLGVPAPVLRTYHNYFPPPPRALDDGPRFRPNGPDELFPPGHGPDADDDQ